VLATSILAIAIILTASLLFTQLASANSSLRRERTKVTDLNAQVGALKAEVSGLQGHVSDLDSKVNSCRSAARMLSDVWDLTLKEQKIDNRATRAANLGLFSLSHLYTRRANVLIHRMNALVRSASSDIRACGLPEPGSVSNF
jgi:hypothetical protein